MILKYARVFQGQDTRLTGVIQQFIPADIDQNPFIRFHSSKFIDVSIDTTMNDPMESFFNSLRTECVHRCHFKTRKQAKAALFDYIEIFYN